MKYYVISTPNYGATELFELSTKEDALECVAKNSGGDTYCRLIEGKEITFKITQIAIEETEK